MLTTANFITMPCTPDLIDGGVAYAVRTLSGLSGRKEDSLYGGLRRAVAAAAVELAFRRYLGERGFPFRISRPAPFTMPDGYFVGLSGHRCRIHTFLISDTQQAAQLRADSSSLLDAPALVPSDQHAADSALAGDLYLFAFVLAAPVDEEHGATTNEEARLLYALPAGWRRPRAWRTFAPLAVKSEGDEVLTVEIGGLNERRDFVSHRITLEPRRRALIDEALFSVSCVQAASPPKGRLGIHSKRGEQTLLIAAEEWRDIGLRATDILLAGYISREEFSRRARQVQVGSQVLQLRSTRVKNLAVDVRQLRPLDGLLSAVR